MLSAVFLTCTKGADENLGSEIFAVIDAHPITRYRRKATLCRL